MGCVTSIPPEGYAQRNIDKKSKQSNKNNQNNEDCHNYNYNPYEIIEGEPEGEGEGIVDTDLHKMSIFIKKYKLDQLRSVIYNERITVDFLLSQNKENIIAIAKQLSDNIIQQNKLCYAVDIEKIQKPGHAQQNALSVAKSVDSISSLDPRPVLEEKSIIEPSILMNKDEFKQRKEAENGGKIRIFIKSPDADNQSLPLFVSFNDSISNVLNAYQQKYKSSFLNKSIIPNVDMQILMFCGQQMMNNKDLNDYGVIPESELCLIYKKKVSNKFEKKGKNVKKVKKAKKVKKKRDKDRIKIFIKTQRHKTCIMSMMVSQNVKIKRLKQKIQRKWGISSENQRLNYNNKELNDESNIFDFGITHNDTIYLTKQMGLYSVFINIKSHKNDKKSITIGIEKCDTIKSIKLQIQLYLDIPIVQQRLVYLGQELLNLNATVKSSNICDGGILYVH